MPKRVEKLILRACDGLREALNTYWPATGNNDLGEATTLFYVGHEFLKAGYSVYSSVPDSSRRMHADLLALNFEEPLVVLFEGKRLFKGGRVASMASDLHRLGEFALPSGRGNTLPKNASAFAVIFATTWDEDIQRWWSNPRRNPRPDNCRADSWCRLHDALETAEIVNAIGISQEPVEEQQYLVYAIAPVESGFRQQAEH